MSFESLGLHTYNHVFGLLWWLGLNNADRRSLAEQEPRLFEASVSRERGPAPSIPSEDRSLSESIELSRKGERSNRPRAVARREVLRRGAKLLYVAPLVLVAMKATPAKANVSGQTPQLPPH